MEAAAREVERRTAELARARAGSVPALAVGVQYQSDGGSTDLVREVCVVNSTSSYQLAFMDEGTSDRTHWVTQVSSTATVVSPILTGSEGDEKCVSVTLTGSGTTLKFNGYGSNSSLWGQYLVGSGSGSSFAYTNGSTASEVEIEVDGELATFEGDDLVWTD